MFFSTFLLRPFLCIPCCAYAYLCSLYFFMLFPEAILWDVDLTAKASVVTISAMISFLTKGFFGLMFRSRRNRWAFDLGVCECSFSVFGCFLAVLLVVLRTFLASLLHLVESFLFFSCWARITARACSRDLDLLLFLAFVSLLSFLKFIWITSFSFSFAFFFSRYLRAYSRSRSRRFFLCHKTFCSD